jgi:Protein of unknown function (DUF4065)
MTPAVDPQKFREVALYLARRTESDPRCGKTKLLKILFYADFAFYRQHRRSITGLSYCKAPHGPIPDGIESLLQQLVEDRLCQWAERDAFGYKQKKLLALREPDLALLSGEELGRLERTVEDLWERTAREVSDLSHEFLGWKLADEGERIPYETVFLGEPRELSAEESAWAAEIWDEYQRTEQAPARTRA